VFGHVFSWVSLSLLPDPELDQEGGDDAAPVPAGAAPETFKGVRGGNGGGETDHRGAEAGAKTRRETGTQDVP